MKLSALAMSMFFLLLFLRALEAQHLYTVSPPSDSRQLLVIVIGGLRWDAVNMTTAGGFRELQNEGVRSEFLLPVFPSLTTPNLYSLVTGRFPSDHGVIGDRMYDKLSNKWFLGPDSSEVNAAWWEVAEPLWITATRSGLRTELYWWPGCEPSLHGTRPEICEPYSSWQQSSDSMTTWKSSIRQVVEKFERNAVNLVQYYIDHVYKTAKSFGINSGEPRVKSAIYDVDNILQELQTLLRNKGLEKNVTVLVCSDHGIAEISPQMNVIRLNEIIDSRDVDKIVENGAVFGIMPIDGRTEQIYQTLQINGRRGIRVYREAELPPAWRYTFPQRNHPITVVAEPGTIILWMGDSSKVVSNPGHWNERVVSGYDPALTSDMRGIFFIRGPDFRINYRHGPIRITDIYNIMASILRLRPLPNQGVWNNVQSMFHSPWQFNSSSRIFLKNLSSLLLMTMLIYFAILA